MAGDSDARGYELAVSLTALAEPCQARSRDVQAKENAPAHRAHSAWKATDMLSCSLAACMILYSTYWALPSVRAAGVGRRSWCYLASELRIRLEGGGIWTTSRK